MHAELLEQAEGIPNDHRFQELPVGEFVNGDAAEGDFFVGGGDAEEVAFMRAGDGPGDSELLLFADSVIDREAEVREGVDEAFDLAAIGFGADGSAANGGVAKGVALGDNLVDELELPIVPDFLVKAANKIFVGGSNGHEKPPGECWWSAERLASVSGGGERKQRRGGRETTPKRVFGAMSELTGGLGDSREWVGSRSLTVNARRPKLRGINIELTPEQEAELERLAAVKGQEPKRLAEEVLRYYLGHEERFLNAVRLGLESLDRGDYVSHHEVSKRIDRIFPA